MPPTPNIAHVRLHLKIPQVKCPTDTLHNQGIIVQLQDQGTSTLCNITMPDDE